MDRARALAEKDRLSLPLGRTLRMAGGLCKEDWVRLCYLLALLRIHNPDCDHCNAHATCGSDL